MWEERTLGALSSFGKLWLWVVGMSVSIHANVGQAIVGAQQLEPAPAPEPGMAGSVAKLRNNMWVVFFCFKRFCLFNCFCGAYC